MDYLFLLEIEMCEHPAFLRTLYFIKIFIEILRILTPIVLVISGMLIFFNAVIGDDKENLSKAVSGFSKKIGLSLAIFVLPVLINTILNLIGSLEMDATDCWKNATLSNIKIYQAKYDEMKALEISNNAGSANSEEIVKSAKFVYDSNASALANEMLRVAYNEIGYCEKATNNNLDSKTANCGGNNYTKYGRDYKNKAKDEYAYAWCAVFVWWVTKETNANGKNLFDDIVKVKNTYAKAYYKTLNGHTFQKSPHYGGTYVPKRGDIILFWYDGDWDKKTVQANHVGIVDTVHDGKVHTVEGNKGNVVKRMSFKLNDSQIMGYAVWE